jgi:hypothetical protein
MVRSRSIWSLAEYLRNFEETKREIYGKDGKKMGFETPVKIGNCSTS